MSNKSKSSSEGFAKRIDNNPIYIHV